MRSQEYQNKKSDTDMKWRNKNFGKHPADPEYDHGYDAEEDRERFEAEQELKEQMRRENYD